MKEFISDSERNKDVIEKTCEDFRAIDPDEIMERASVGNDDIGGHLL